jgi:hypothetical protein
MAVVRIKAGCTASPYDPVQGGPGSLSETVTISNRYIPRGSQGLLAAERLPSSALTIDRVGAQGALGARANFGCSLAGACVAITGPVTVIVAVRLGVTVHDVTSAGGGYVWTAAQLTGWFRA